MSRPSVFNEWGEAESLPLVVDIAHGRILGVAVDDELVPFEQPPADEPSRGSSSWWRRLWPPRWP
jgi:hypothetical protein